MTSKRTNDFLGEAYKEALKAQQKDEVPVGAVIVLDGKIIARAHNLKEQKQKVTGHAEILAVEKAARKLDSWRLENCDVYVTLEPCPMCAAVLQQSRVKNVYFGVFDKKGGAISLDLKIHDHSKLNHKYKMTCVERSECGELLSNYFKSKRKKKITS